MKSLNVKNFRSINDSGNIEIRPLTILLGKNSCGKSTFIRMFPLLKQSLEVDTSEPLLWYGDYVDFGSYSSTRPFKKSNKNFELSFVLNIDLRNRYYYLPYRYYLSYRQVEPNIEIKINVSFAEANISSFSFCYYDQNIKVELGKNNIIKSIIINDNDAIVNVKDYRWGKNGKELIPHILEKADNSRNYDELSEYQNFYRGIISGQGAIGSAARIIKKYSHSRMGQEGIFEILMSLTNYHSQETLLKQLRNNKRSKILSESFKNIDITDKDFVDLNDLIVFIGLENLIYSINSALNDEFANTFYLKPLRANVNRFYRVQGINNTSIDSNGSNLPMIMYNMAKDKIDRFGKWSLDKLGLVFSVNTHEGHVSLVVKDLDNNEVNLADTGYGYSQMLPIIVQLWLLKDKLSNFNKEQKYKYTVVIEQPELHLHPAFQAKLINIFVGLVNEMNLNGNEFKIIFETHSETMINRLGRLVNKEEISSDFINIVLVEKEDGASLFLQTEYNDQGYIDKWPIGFMSAEE